MKLLQTTLLTTALIAGAASAESIRLVLSNTSINNGLARSMSVNSGGCVNSAKGDASWCIPESVSQKIASQSKAYGSEQTKKNSFKQSVFFVDSQGYSVNEIVSAFNSDGRFGLVEEDVKVTEQGFDVNDPYYQFYQLDYFSAKDYFAGGVNIEGLWAAIGEESIVNKSDPVDVIVIDSSFHANEDMPYYDGRNFSTTALVKDGPRQLRSDDYTPPDDWEELGCNGHGLGVASVIGASINNELGHAGITNNINMYAIKGMTCGTGFLSDISAILLWLAGENYEGVTPYQGKPGIVNLSLAAKSEGVCYSFMQNAINKAIDAGFTIVASAGNESKDALLNTPSNCEGVISVGALMRTGELADFSNFGESLSVVAPGVDIAGYHSVSGTTGLWQGTSFSAPLVAGSLAVIKQRTGANNDELATSLKFSSSVETLESQCQEGLCGAGLPDFAKTLAFAERFSDGMFNSIAFALSDKDECEQTWLIDNFSGAANMCELYKVTFFGDYIEAGTAYKMISIDLNDEWGGESQTREGYFEKATVMMKDIDVSSRRYGFKVCTKNGCGEVVELNTVAASETNRPALCKSQ
jgi:serine protease